MNLWQKILLLLLAATLVTLTVLTWGSLGSAAALMCLITLCSALLFQKFMTNRDPNDVDME